MTTIYHNPRCSKSRACHTIMAEVGKEVTVVNYIKTPFTEEKLSEIIGMLNITPIELVRTSEKIWKEKFKGKKMTPNKVIEAMLAHPSLIQRPIVVKGATAIIARPPELVLELL
jgi:arsenate reductase